MYHWSTFNPSPGFKPDLVLMNEAENCRIPHSQRSNQGPLPRGCRCTHLRDADLQHRPVGPGAWLLPEPKAPGPGHEATLARK